MKTQNITLVEDAIHNPKEPRHFMVFEEGHEISCSINGLQIASTKRAIKVKEVARSVYDPVFYIPREDVDLSMFQHSSKSTYCPLKGKTEYFHFATGGKVFRDVAWSYVDMLDFDKRLELIKGHIAFDQRYISTHQQ